MVIIRDFYTFIEQKISFVDGPQSVFLFSDGLYDR
jgi:hypothetical protein